MSEVVADAARHRLVLEEDGATAFLVYRRLGDGRIVLAHTEVPPEIGGRGVGGRLVAAAVDWAKREGLTVVPSCPFVGRWLSQHPTATDGLGVDWDAARLA